MCVSLHERVVSSHPWQGVLVVDAESIEDFVFTE